MTEDGPDWDRWHELLDIRDGRGFTDAELLEYQRWLPIVAKLDAQDEAVSDRSLTVLEAKHAKVIESIERLTAKIRSKV